MKVPSIQKISPIEMVLFVAFILYLIFPIPTPAPIIPYINTSFTIGVIIIFTIYLLFYTTPILGVLSLFVAYELLHRSSNGFVLGKVPMVRHTPTQPKKDLQMQNMNPKQEVTLEEDIVQSMAPIGKNTGENSFINTAFKPLQENIDGASLIQP